MSPDHSDAAELLALLERDGGWSKIAREVRDLGAVRAVSEARGALQGDLFDEEADLASATTSWQSRLLKLEADGIVCVPISSQNYPEAARRMASPAPVLFLRGQRDARDHRGVAVIGSRRASPTSLEIARVWSRLLADAGVVVVSGLAAGIDREAHLGAMEAGGRTVAVLGTGVSRSYPPENAGLQEQVARRGLLVSQFLPDHGPSKATFPLRNALMAAWAGTTLVIDARERSGASLQARLTVKQGQRLLIHEQLAAEPWAQKYVDAGRASLVASTQDVQDTL